MRGELAVEITGKPVGFSPNESQTRGLIPAEMQHRVTNAVRSILGPPPDIFLRHSLQTVGEHRKKLLRDEHPRCLDKFLGLGLRFIGRRFH